MFPFIYQNDVEDEIKSRRVKLNECSGKIVNRISLSEGAVFISFTDGTYAVVSQDFIMYRPGYPSEMDRHVLAEKSEFWPYFPCYSSNMIEAGICTKEDLDRAVSIEETKSKMADLETKRRDYEKLKAVFEAE